MRLTKEAIKIILKESVYTLNDSLKDAKDHPDYYDEGFAEDLEPYQEKVLEYIDSL